MARRAAVLAAVTALAALAAAAPAQASCSAARASGSQVVTKTREAIVFTRSGVLYGCLSSTGVVRRLPDEGGGADVTGVDRPRLAGRYVAYSTAGSGIGDEFDRLYVYDLRAGRRFLVESSNVIRSIVVKRNGSVGWIEAATVDPAGTDPVWQVRKWSNEERQSAVLVDRGADIEPESLALTGDRNGMTWVRGTVRGTSLR